ncbi:hypothetical protein COV16_04160 [Candidatus Woesearchaeota archaeon CG10_big_fil_rev_8_21_14_0_10_34_8]|nr:MAG: hypothetical protein COV16_04160 [Candidatus Woesearchaeota archaeon CG10_big_fil_rev_8_21_14_0_10_34_8]
MTIMKDKGLCIENKILLVIIAIAVFFVIKHLLKTSSLLFIIINISSLVIYGVAIFGLIRNNKSWAWIIAGIPIFWMLFNPLKPTGIPSNYMYSYGTLTMVFQAIFNADPQTVIQKTIESVIPLIVIVFIVVNIFRFRKTKKVKP